MARLVEVGDALPATLTVKVGDVVNFAASGGVIESGEEALEALGPFVPGIVGVDGQLMSPETPPTNMLFRAAGPGRARIALTTGFGLASPDRRRIDIIVED